MRRDVQEIFRSTPHEKQVMMFSATLSKEIRPVCKKFMQDVITLHHYFLSLFLLNFSFSPCSVIVFVQFILFGLQKKYILPIYVGR